jgi:hypothetical protein
VLSDEFKPRPAVNLSRPLIDSVLGVTAAAGYDAS